MKLLQSLCLASVFAAKDKDERAAAPTCLISDLNTGRPKNFWKWECYNKQGDKVTGSWMPVGTKCYLDCLPKFSEYRVGGPNFHKCTKRPFGTSTTRNEWNNPSRLIGQCERDINQVIEEVDDIQAKSQTNSLRINSIANTNLFRGLPTVVQKDVKLGSFGNVNFELDVPTDVPKDAGFLLADIFINDSENQNWSVTFSKDKNADCRGFSLADTGNPPLTDSDGRTQTVTISYQADQVVGSDSFPRFGQWSSSMVIPMGLVTVPNTIVTKPVVNVCIAGKDEAIKNASVIMYIRGYFEDS